MQRREYGWGLSSDTLAGGWMGMGASGEAEQHAQILKSQCAQHRGEHTVSCSYTGELGCSGQGILSHGQGQGVFQEQKKFTDGI